MENMAAKNAASFFDTKGLRYEIAGAENDIIILDLLMDNRGRIKVVLYFSKDCTEVNIRNFDLARVPETKKMEAVQICNTLNLNYRWIRFFYDEERQTIVAADDALIQLDSCGKEVLRCCNQLMDIADEAYPLVLQALYA